MTTDAPLYTLVGAHRSRAARVSRMLEELGLAYTILPARPRSAEIRALNPEGKIPALVLPGGAVLTDSVAIMTFLADRHGDPDTGPTFPAGDAERGVQDAHTQFLVDALDGPLWTISKHRMALPERLRVPAVIETAKEELVAGFEQLAARVGDGPHLMGARYTLPDILAGHLSGWAAVSGLKPPDAPGLGAYVQRLRARPANERARLKAEAAENSAAGR